MKSVSIRFDHDTLEKIRYIAAQELRSVNSQILILLRHCVEEYEATHGPIHTSNIPLEK